jgi:hypothetical protein
MQMELVSRIVNLVTQTIQTIEDALKLFQENLRDLITENISSLKEAFLKIEWYYCLGYGL